MLGSDYFVQVGEVDFGGTGNMEALIIQRQARGASRKSYSFNLPSKLLFTLCKAMQHIIDQSGVKEGDL
jgi:hypothetical protein